jgi:hypothetical protein
MDIHLSNNAQDVPFSFIVEELIAGNIEKSPAKYAVYKKM